MGWDVQGQTASGLGPLRGTGRLCPGALCAVPTVGCQAWGRPFSSQTGLLLARAQGVSPPVSTTQRTGVLEPALGTEGI